VSAWGEDGPVTGSGGWTSVDDVCSRMKETAEGPSWARL
jgi:hypothetical protein